MGSSHFVDRGRLMCRISGGRGGGSGGAGGGSSAGGAIVILVVLFVFLLKHVDAQSASQKEGRPMDAFLLDIGAKLGAATGRIGLTRTTLWLATTRTDRV